MIKCQKCGHENLDDSFFCNSCGEKLVQKEKYKCSKCGREFSGENAYCNGCGAKLVYAKEDEAYAIKINKISKEPEQTQANPNKITTIRIAITNGLLILATFLMMISVYLPSVKTVGLGVKETLGLSYLFKDMWKNIDSGSLSNFSEAIAIIYFCLFICASILSLVFGIITIIKASKGIARKSAKFPINMLTGVYVPVLTYFVFGLMSNYSKVVYTNELVKTTYAAGGVIAIVATSIMLLALIFDKVMKFVLKEEKEIISSSIGLSMAVIAFIIPLVCFTSLFIIKDSGTKIYSSIQQFIGSVSAEHNFDITIALSCVSEILLLSAFGLAIALFALAIKNISIKKAVLPTLIVSSLLFIFSISLAFVSKEAIINILTDLKGGSQEAYYAIKDYTYVGPSAIALIVISMSMIGASITSLAIKNK